VYPVKQQTGGEIKDVDAIEIEGVILPCTIRKLVASVAARLERSVEQPHKQLTSPSIARAAIKDEGVGSHYIVLHAITDKQSNRPLGANGSLVFNGWKRDEIECTVASDEVRECRHGTVLQLIVWDSSREQVVACKVEPALTGLFMNGIMKSESLSFRSVASKKR
jgi:hypothetical protein